MTFSGVDHTGFAVSDMGRSVSWYTKVLERAPALRRVWEHEYIGRLVGYAGCRMECTYWQLPGGAKLELIEYLEPPPGVVRLEPHNVGNGHLCLIADDLRAEFARLAQIGVEFRHPEPIEIPWGPSEGGWTCYAVDPDGILVQLLQPPPQQAEDVRGARMGLLGQLDVSVTARQERRARRDGDHLGSHTSDMAPALVDRVSLGCASMILKVAGPSSQRLLTGAVPCWSSSSTLD